jgi:uncharacterized membrane protein
MLVLIWVLIGGTLAGVIGAYPYQPWRLGRLMGDCSTSTPIAAVCGDFVAVLGVRERSTHPRSSMVRKGSSVRVRHGLSLIPAEAVDGDVRASDDLAMTTPTANNQPKVRPRQVGLLQRWIVPLRRAQPANPILLRQAEQRAEYAQNRLADAITAFAGSMMFVYIHILWFGCWIGFGVEKYPFGLLTMIVSLEAIFLSTFVLISQNRADAKRQVIADQQWSTVQVEEQQNERLIALSEQMLKLVEEVRGFADFAQQDHEQNAELLDLSRRTFALTTEVHRSSSPGGPGNVDSEVSSGHNPKGDED